MYLKNLKLKNFRNYDDIDIDFDKNLTIVMGDNGKGKTNLLESIYYISTGRSHRTNKQDELIKWKKDYSIIRAFILEGTGKDNKIKKPLREHVIEVELRRKNNIRIRIDRSPARKKSDFITIMPSVFFSPDDLSIVKGSPSGRRDFLDSVLEKVQKDYQYLSARYQKILNQRNSLIKSMVDKNVRGRNNTIETWDENLIRYGSKIIMSRLQLFSEMQKIFFELMNIFFPELDAKIFYILSWDRIKGNDDSVSINSKYDYPSFSGIYDSLNMNDIEKKFKQILADNFSRELAYKTTVTGPHRDDFMVFLGGKDIRSFGSQGQQRVATICLRLCELMILKNRLNKDPLLLLDDILSELDPEKEKQVLEVIGSGCQTFITTSNSNFIDLKGTDIMDEVKKIHIKDRDIEII